MKNKLKEKRKNIRYHIELDGKIILSDNSSFKGKTKDLSFGGAYLYCVNSLSVPEGETCFLELTLEGTPQSSILKFYCKIIHVNDSGVGLQFINIDIFHYEQFKNLMVFNSSDPDALLAELEKSPGLEIKKK